MAFDSADTSVVQLFLEFCHSLEGCGTLDECARMALDESLRCLGAARGALFVWSAGELASVASSGVNGAVSVTVASALQRMFTGADVDVAPRVCDSDQRPPDPSFVAIGASAVAVVPFVTAGEFRGALYLDQTVPGNGFPDDAAFLLKTLATFAAPVLDRLLRDREAQSVSAVRTVPEEEYDLLSIVGRSPRLQTVLVKIAQVASMNIPVLIEGESGTGKELLARALHLNGDRRDGPFVALNCGAIPEHLLTSELFGYERGAFTGAARSTQGKFESADGGTLFLDEVSELPPAIQVALLRVLQSGEFYRLGSSVGRHTDARIVAATNRRLGDLVGENRFRQDLYYRLNVVRITVPPLRERPEDIPLLVAHFIRKQNARLGRDIRTMSPDAFDVIAAYQFPGNVRELENAIHYAVATAATDVLQVVDLPDEIRGALPRTASSTLRSLDDVRAEQDRIEREYLEQLLDSVKGNISEASKRSGLNRTYLHALINRHGIRVGAFRSAKATSEP